MDLNETVGCAMHEGPRQVIQVSSRGGPQLLRDRLILQSPQYPTRPTRGGIHAATVRTHAKSRIGIILLLGSLAVPQVYAQQDGVPTQTQKSGQKTTDRPQRAARGRVAAAKKRIVELQGKLDEYHQGRRNDEDGYVILWKMLHEYGEAQMSDSPEARTALQEWRKLSKLHPDYATHQPMYLSEQKASLGRAQSKKLDFEARARTWAPPDSQVMVLFGTGDRLVAVFQYRLEFYQLPKGQSLSAGVSAESFREAIEGHKIQAISAITFRHRIDVPHSPRDDYGRSFWACTDLVHDYAARSRDEIGLMAARKRLGLKSPWVNASGKLEDFCGAIAPDGTEIYQLNIPQSAPDALLRVLQVSHDGERAAIMVGEKVTDEVDGGPEIGHPKKLLIWEYPSTLHELDAADRASAKAALSQYGFEESRLVR